MSMGSTMVKRTSCSKKIFFLCVLGALCGSFRVVAVAAPPVRTMYTDALAREQRVRAALAAPDAAPAVLGDVRALVAVYEALVRRYPASGYSDNALWQAGRLSMDAFARFGLYDVLPKGCIFHSVDEAIYALAEPAHEPRQS